MRVPASLYWVSFSCVIKLFMANFRLSQVGFGAQTLVYMPLLIDLDCVCETSLKRSIALCFCSVSLASVDWMAALIFRS